MPGSVSARPAARSPLTSSIIPRATMACTRSTIRRRRISRGWQRPTMTSRKGGGGGGGGGLVLAQPPVQHRRALGAPHGLELPPEARVGRRRRVESLEEGAHVEAGAAHHGWQSAPAPALREGA